MTDEPLKRKTIILKLFIWVGAGIIILSIALLIVNNGNKVVCENSTYDYHNQRWQLEVANPTTFAEPNQRIRIDSETVSRIERIALMKVSMGGFHQFHDAL